MCRDKQGRREPISPPAVSLSASATSAFSLSCLCRLQISWDKPRLNSNATVPPARSIDQINLIQSSNKSALCNTVILDHSVAAGSSARYKIAEMHVTPQFESCRRRTVPMTRGQT